MTATEQQVITAIKPYLHQQEILKRIIRKHNKLSQHDFDNIFSNNYRKEMLDGSVKVFRRRLRFPMFQTLHGFMLGDLYQGEWSKWLDLTQWMEVLSIVKIETVNSEIFYSLN